MTTPEISLGFPPGPLALEAAELAERLGYHRIWLYDSAAIWEDVWVHMGRIATATDRIGLGTAVLVPNLRHVMTTASAIATIERLAPGRLVAGFGTGFTARFVLDQAPLTWATTDRYVGQLRGLLAGEVVEIDGKQCQMIHHPAMAEPRPVDVPIVLSAMGPRGQAIARDTSDGLMSIGPGDGTWNPYYEMVHGTVLDADEDPRSSRAVDAAGPWWVVMFHGMWAGAGPAALAGVPGADAWLEQVASDRPEGQHHLAVHEGHCTHVTDRDRLLIDGAGEELAHTGWVGEPEEIRDRVAASGDAGTTEIIYNPAGSDPLREIEAFAAAVL
ncbi:MAG: LLM class flavin-dependent oxidoreductase [Acidimicrobiia bacterium]|nr:LLM class flavin-dependent oxidoreductase [Acidimicrobiia bacterium]